VFHPAGGFVLAAGASAAGREALARLQPGDPVRLLVSKGGQTRELGSALTGARWSAPVGADCRGIYLAVATESTAVAGAYLGTVVVHYRDGTQEARRIHFGHQALALQGREPPRSMDGTAWIVERPQAPRRCLVYEWKPSKLGTPVALLSFEPAPAALELGYRVLAVTCAAGMSTAGGKRSRRR
jgi:hypothetical protein